MRARDVRSHIAPDVRRRVAVQKYKRQWLTTTPKRSVALSNSCVLPKGYLPGKQDADPTWRPSAKFKHAEVERRISDESIRGLPRGLRCALSRALPTTSAGGALGTARREAEKLGAAVLALNAKSPKSEDLGLLRIERETGLEHARDRKTNCCRDATYAVSVAEDPRPLWTLVATNVHPCPAVWPPRGHRLRRVYIPSLRQSARTGLLASPEHGSARRSSNVPDSFAHE